MGTARDLSTDQGLFDEYYPRLCAFFRSRGYPEEEALDLASVAMAKVLEKRSTLRSADSLGSWIMKVAANTWKNDLRWSQAEKRDAPEVPLDTPEGDAIVEAALAAAAGDPETRLLDAERLRAANACLAALPPRRRACLRHFLFQQWKYQEIADALGISIQAVKSHIHQARQQVKECVARRLAGEVR